MGASGGETLATVPEWQAACRGDDVWLTFENPDGVVSEQSGRRP